MMREEAFVVTLDGEYAQVSGHRKSGCGSCHQQGGCSILSMGAGNRETLVRVLNPIGAQVGDKVILELSERLFLRASFLVYILPLMVLLAVGILVRYWAMAWEISPKGADGLAAVAGLASLFAVFFLLGRYNRSLQQNRTSQPVIREVVGGMAFIPGMVSECSGDSPPAS